MRGFKPTADSRVPQVQAMQLPDEAVTYQFQSLLLPPMEEWTAAAELRAQHYLSPARLKAIAPQMMQVRSQVATERELQIVPPEQQPLEPGFIDLPQKFLDNQRRKGDASEVGRVLSVAARLKERVDRVLILGYGGVHDAARALFDGLCHAYHNELPSKGRMQVPRIYFEGYNLDTDNVQELLELIESTCVDSEVRDERWGAIVVGHGNYPLETAAIYRIVHKEASQFYGAKSPLLREVIVPITTTQNKLGELARAQGTPEDEILSIPERIGHRFSAFTAAGLLPAGVMGLDVRALLLGAAATTRRFLEEPFERNPVLQYAAVNYLMTEEHGKPIRTLAVWSRKLEALGDWYAALVSECLGKQGRGPTPLTLVQTRDLPGKGQLHQEGARDKLINSLVVKSPRTTPLGISMADHNQDELNTLNRKTFPELQGAAQRAVSQISNDVARPMAELTVPTLSEHTMGQLMQMLMLATVVEARLRGVNPYSQPGLEPFQRNLRSQLKG